MSEYDKVNWKLAECAGTYPDVFFRVEEERNKEAYTYINAVRSICARCQIWEQCLTYAFRNEQYGVWGGLTAVERYAYRKDKYAMQKERAEEALSRFGITPERIQELYEHSRHDRRVENQPAPDGEDGDAGYR